MIDIQNRLRVCLKRSFQQIFRFQRGKLQLQEMCSCITVLTYLWAIYPVGTWLWTIDGCCQWPFQGFLFWHTLYS
jgi:hypothetical protein